MRFPAHLYILVYFIMQLFSQSRFALCCISLQSDFIYLFSLFVFEKFQYIFNNAEYAIPRSLSFRSILLIFCFKSMALFFSLSPFLPFSLSLSLILSFSHLFTYLPRQGNSSCKHTTSKNSATDHTRISPIRREYMFSQRKHDIRANEIFFFHQFLQCARSVMCLALNLQDKVIVELPINQIDPLFRMKGNHIYRL